MKLVLNFTLVILSVAGFSALLLFPYAFGFFWISLRSLVSGISGSGRLSGPENQDASVTVLVPAKGEGELAWRAVESVLKQDYAGKILALLVVPNKDDSSYVAAKKYLAPENAKAWGANRRFEIVLTGTPPKHEQLNYALDHRIFDRNDADFIGFLDADHVADAGWVQASVARLHQTPDWIAVQARRRPTSVTRIFQLWDSAENHLGHELYNRYQSEGERSVFFTGSTAIFRRTVFDRRRFSGLITEDTALSFELLADGGKIGYEPTHGSAEEVAPTLQSYLSRRRRWAAGHTRAAFDQIAFILRSPLRVRWLLHGAYFLAFTVGFVFVSSLALHTLFQLRLPTRALLMALSVLGGVGFSLLCWGRGRAGWLERGVASLMIAPWVVLFWPLAMRLADDPAYPFLIRFPYVGPRAGLEFFFTLAPIIPALVGNYRFRLFSLSQCLVFLVTSPLLMVFDLYAGLLGFADFILGRTTWAAWIQTQRAGPGAVQPRWASLTRDLSTLAIMAIALIVGHDAWVTSPCDGSAAWLLFKNPRLQLNSEFTLGSPRGDELSVEIRAIIPNAGSAQVEPEFSLFENGVQLAKKARYSTKLPLGFSNHVFLWKMKTLDSSGTALVCDLPVSIPTSKLETKNGKLWLNGEPFLIKGVVPTFASPQVNIDLTVGMRQIKALGANAVRFYHRATPALVDAATRAGLLLIEQPDESTWDNAHIDQAADLKNLVRRYTRLLEERQSNPYSLLIHFGNELELGSRSSTKLPILRDQVLPGLRTSVNEAWNSPVKNTSWIQTYSTYLAVGRYPLDILGVNMLDTGSTYWNQALKRIQTEGVPFYASEFGGFVAAQEVPPTQIRIRRMEDQWAALTASGSSGAVVFESHDNWAQPTFNEVNDPFSPDHPDDVRGIWDPKNRPKPEKETVERIFSDVQATLLTSNSGGLSLRIQNIRPYVLSDVRVRSDFPTPIVIGTLKPGESRTIPLSAAERSLLKPLPDGRVRWTFEGSTHHGLPFQSIQLTPLRGLGITVLASDWIPSRLEPGNLEGFLYRSSEFPYYSAQSVTINGNSRAKGESKVALSAPFQDARNLQVTWDSKKVDFDPLKIKRGLVEFSFDAPEIPKPEEIADAWLILAGIGSSTFTINGQSMNCHAYRECLVHLGLPWSPTYTVKTNRQDIDYWTANDDPLKIGIQINMERPKFFFARKLHVRINP